MHCLVRYNPFKFNLIYHLILFNLRSLVKSHRYDEILLNKIENDIINYKVKRAMKDTKQLILFKTILEY